MSGSETTPPPGSPALVPGRNVWRVERASRAAVLIDGDAYFGALRAAMRAARHSIRVLGWDLDSRTRLDPAASPADGLPACLGPFLDALVRRSKTLRVDLLGWDFAMIYQLEREFLPAASLDWRTHRRIRFRLDGRHPSGASHHQKVVVVDDRIAFVGGLDLTQRRWDTPAHRADEPARRDAAGAPYAPFHDVQMLVDGDAAAAVSELARQRWADAGARPCPVAPPDGGPDPWPEAVAPEFRRLRVGIARTRPAFAGEPGVGEVLRLHEDLLGAARNAVYIENQYFTSSMLAPAVEARLSAANGPQFLMVSRRDDSGWLEAASMGVLRGRWHARLRRADRHGRYRFRYPRVPGLGQDCLNVHSKVMIVDERWLLVGSANMNNRSMRLDTECVLVIDADGDDAAAAGIARVRHRLLAEHLGATPAQIAGAERAHRSLFGAVDALGGGERDLVPLDPALDPGIDSLVPPDQAPIDPEEPIDVTRLLGHFVPPRRRRSLAGRLWLLGAATLALLGLALAWRFTPLSGLLDVDALMGFVERLAAMPLAPLLVVAAFVLASLAMVPVTVLIAVAGLAFGPVAGFAVALAGALGSALLAYLAGRLLGRDLMRRLAGRTVNRLSRRIARRGVLAMAAARLIPVAPFTIVNLVAGASHLRVRDFALGTLLGMGPGIVLTVVFVDRLVAAVREPGPVGIAVAGLIALGLVGLAWTAQRLVGRGRDAAAAPAEGG